MDKFAERKSTGGRLIATAAVAMCLLGRSGAGMAYAAPVPQSTETGQNLQAVSGTVSDAEGNPIIGANVVEKGTKRGVVTDLDGKFSLKVAPGATLEISYLGYEKKSQKASGYMDIVLTEDNELLDEVVVVGYGMQKKVNLTGAVANVDVEKAVASRPITDIAKAL